MCGKIRYNRHKSYIFPYEPYIVSLETIHFHPETIHFLGLQHTTFAPAFYKHLYMIAESLQESIEIIVLLVAGLICLIILALPLIIENRNNNKKKVNQ